MARWIRLPRKQKALGAGLVDHVPLARNPWRSGRPVALLQRLTQRA
jgi:hypothetical protein